MNFPVYRHLLVETDIIELAEWIARDSSAAALRFTHAAEETILSLGEMPGKGSPKNLRPKRLKNVRTWAVAGFPKHLIFYEVRQQEVYVLAVIHGSRRYTRILISRV